MNYIQIKWQMQLQWLDKNKKNNLSLHIYKNGNTFISSCLSSVSEVAIKKWYWKYDNIEYRMGIKLNKNGKGLEK